MKRSSILAAVIAFVAIVATASVSAKTYDLSTDDLEICRILELAHESSCAEYETTVARQVAAAKTDEPKNA
jgi:hypothetical protein